MNIEHNHLFKAYPFSSSSNDETMIQYLKDFNALKLKYSVDPKFDSTLLSNVLDDISHFESSYQYGNLTKQEYSSIEDNLKLVYGDNNIVHNDVLAYHLTEKKIIHQYLSIPELDKMFDEDYFNFEWDIHAGQNFSEHRNDYNRDHFIHQIRNMYMMLIFLNNYNFFDATYNIFTSKGKGSGKIIEYVQKKQQEFLNDKSKPHFNLFNNFFLKKDDVNDDIEANESFDKHATVDNEIESILDNKLSGTTKSFKTIDSVEEYAKYYFLKYVIYASSILSALFHDMGYPICYFLEMRHRVSEYNPTLYMFTHNAIDSFDQLETKLSNSLLFTIVSSHEIKNSLQINSKGKYNHGAYSAIAFLLQFYNTGIIHSLSLEKQCAIEIAALAIYNHTVKYNCIKNTDNNNYYQPSFRQNPISFLLRLCDDIQEWDRRYFEISTDSDLTICPKCLTPPLYVAYNNQPTTDADGKKYKPKTYGEFKCHCNDSIFRYDSFLKRKIYVVTVADSVETDIINNTFCISINYDLYKLLKMARVNNTYAKFRLNELNDLKTLLKNQLFNVQSNKSLNFKYMYLNYFMTSNPITIKIKILERYLFNKYGKKFEEKLKTITLEEVFKDIFDLDSKDKAVELNSNLYHYLNNKAFKFYIELLLIALQGRTINEKNSIKDGIINEKSTDSIDNFIKQYTPKEDQFTSYKLYSDTLVTLIKDCIFQYSKEIDISGGIKESFIAEQNYYKQYAPEDNYEDLVYDSIAVYCNSNNYFNKYYDDDDKKYIGYYTDLYFFDRLNEKIKNSNEPSTSTEKE